MKKIKFETIIGLLVIIATLVCIAVANSIVNKNTSSKRYTLYATFDNIEGINVYSKIKVGGVEVGEVSNVKINDRYKIVLSLKINEDCKIPVDSMIKITTSGIIGSKYLKIDMGGEDEFLSAGDYFEFTQSTMDLEDMITKFFLNKAKTDEKK